jgi:hypothetical protein
MRKIGGAVCLLGLALGWARAGEGGDAAACKAVIDKAIKALGGEAKLKKAKAVTLKGTGTYYGLGEGVPFTGEWSIQLPRQLRVAIESKANDQTFRMIRVVSGDKGWIKFNDDDVKTMDKEALAEEHHSLYVHWVATLAPLGDKSLQLAPLGETKVNGQEAVGVRVSHKGRRDVQLYFDKTTGLPVKMETMVKDPQAGGDTEYTQETFMSDYKDIDGLKLATKESLKRDGKRFVEVEWTEIRPADKLDDSLFARP